MVVRHPLRGAKKKKSKGSTLSHPSRWPVETRIAIVPKNPKGKGSSAFERYQKYKHAKTVQEALDSGMCMGDLVYDFKRGYISRKSVTNRNAVEYVVSLGTRCFVAEVLRDAGLRRFACPFDWIYSSPEMVAHCLTNKFVTFLDPSQITKSGNAFGHKHYSSMLARGIIYPHHNPRECMADFKRRVTRFNKVIQSGKRKLFIICDTIETIVRRREAENCNPALFRNVFDSLRKKGCKNFELLAINVMCGQASEATSTGRNAKPVITKLRKHCLKAYTNLLTVYNFQSTGPCTGLRFKAKRDTEALGALFNGERSFDLADDPLPTGGPTGVISKKPAAHLAQGAKRRLIVHPNRTVKRLNDGSWLSKGMD